jgi:TrmH family RNA methyltransferase
MLTLRKLSTLSAGARGRKVPVILRKFENDLVSGCPFDVAYLTGLLIMVAADDFWPESVRKKAGELALTPVFVPSSLRKIYSLRHGMLNALGQDWADWDSRMPGDSLPVVSGAIVRPIRVYLEGFRSPFNVGSVARTCLAFGMERLWCSRDGASPDHRRSRRSAMGALDRLRWDVADLAELERGETGPLFALELGGISLNDFKFPESGTVILGSEELGVSPESLKLAEKDRGVVSIPMPGPKASLNVGVAFGILVRHWVDSTG